MSHVSSVPNRLVQALLCIALSVVLAACAGRPKQIEPVQPVTVTEVRVITQNMTDFGFADRLQQRLAASAGRPASDTGQAVTLRIVMLDRAAEIAPVSFFPGSPDTVSLDLALVDAQTGETLRSQTLRASSRHRDSSGVLISKLTEDIRALLGLSGVTPYPVSAARHSVAFPQGRTDPTGDGAPTDAARLAADPLLNGTVTPTSISVDIGQEAEPTMDISRPLLDPAPSATPQVKPEAHTPPVLVSPARSPALPLRTRTTGLEFDEADEPCIITLENDCSDPDDR